MNIAIYIVAASIGLLLSSMGIVFALIGGLEFAYLIGGLLVAAHIGSVFYVRMKAMEGKGRQAAVVLALPLPVVGGVLYIFAGGICAIASGLFAKMCG